MIYNIAHENKWIAEAWAFMSLLDQSAPACTQSFDSLDVSNENQQQVSLSAEWRRLIGRLRGASCRGPLVS